MSAFEELVQVIEAESQALRMADAILAAGYRPVGSEVAA